MKFPFDIFGRQNNSRDYEYERDWSEEVSEERDNTFATEEFFENKDDHPSEHMKIAYLIAGVVFLLIFSKLFNLQITFGALNREKAENNRIRQKVITAPRGLVYDRKGKILAENSPNFSIVVYLTEIPTEEKEKEDYFNTLDSVSKLNKDEIEEKVKKTKGQLEPLVLEENVNRERALILDEKLAEIRGVSIEKRASRKYPEGIYFSHIIGNIGALSEKDILNFPAYSLNDKIGKAGLESYFEEELKGVNGKEQIEISADGSTIRNIANIREKPGNNLKLHLDSNLQKKATEALRKSLRRSGAEKGVVVVQNVKTGGILTLVSLPSFNNNIFSSEDSGVKYKKLLDDSKQPLFNRAISGVYPSGSTIKQVVAAAGLEEGVITPYTTILDKGFIEIENPYNKEIKYRYKDWAVHGWVDVKKAIAISCNVFFYHVGGGFDHIRGLGIEKIVEYFKKFGLSRESGIDLPGEASGFVPDRQWKKEVKNESWNIGDTYLTSIGQGDLLLTPLQLNNITATIANGGDLAKPRLVSEIVGPDGKTLKKIKTEYLKKNVVSDKSLRLVRAGLRQGVTSGSSSKLSDLPVSVAGKTGTAETGETKKSMPHGWYTAFAPYENPQIAITVLVEKGGEGATFAVPVAKEILRYYFTRK